MEADGVQSVVNILTRKMVMLCAGNWGSPVPSILCLTLSKYQHVVRTSFHFFSTVWALLETFYT